MTVEEYLAEWQKQGPTARVTDAEMEFIHFVRRSAHQGVGYGWMQNIIEVEWNEVAKDCGGGWGPNYFMKQITELEARIAELERQKADRDERAMERDERCE